MSFRKAFAGCFVAALTLGVWSLSAQALTLSAELGGVMNRDGANENTRYFAPGAKLSSDFLFDVLSIEVGAYYYTVSNFYVVNDSFSVLPVVATARVEFPIGPFRPFVYAGVLKNFVLSSQPAGASGNDLLGSTYPALGVGAFLSILGPLSIRADVGYDQIAAGLSLGL